MPSLTLRIERVAGADDALVDELTDVLLDAVQSGAGVSFMSDLTREGAA